MTNRILTPQELERANALLLEIREKLVALSGSDAALLFAYRRKIQKELSYEERSKPSQRKALKAYKMKEQGGRCLICEKPLPATYAVLDRYVAINGYTRENTRLIHAECDSAIQSGRGYK